MSLKNRQTDWGLITYIAPSPDWWFILELPLDEVVKNVLAKYLKIYIIYTNVNETKQKGKSPINIESKRTVLKNKRATAIMNSRRRVMKVFRHMNQH